MSIGVSAEVAHKNRRIDIGKVAQFQPLLLEHVFEHGRHGAAFQDRFARHFRIVIRARRLHPRFDLEMLVFEGVRQFVGHHGALVFRINPVRDIEFMGLWVVQAGDLLRQEVHHKAIQIEPFGDQSKGLRAAFGGIALLGILFVVHLAEDIGVDFLA